MSLDPNLQDILADLEDSINRMKVPQSSPPSHNNSNNYGSVAHQQNQSDLTRKMENLRKLKEQAIMNEEYEAAAKYKSELEALQSQSGESFESDSRSSRMSSISNAPAPRKESYLEEPIFKASDDPSVLFGNRSAAAVSEGHATPSTKMTPSPSASSSTNSASASTNSASAAKAAAPVKASGPPENSKLVLEAFGGRYNAVVTMLDAGAFIDSVDFNTGNTALVAAAEPGHTQIIKLLVDRGANVNAKNRRGRTALHYTIERRYDDITMFLVEVGRADSEIADNLGITALSLASKIPQLFHDLTVLQGRNKKELIAEKIAESAEQTGEVTIYLRNKGFPIQIRADNNAGQVTAAMSKILKLEEIVKDLQIFEDAMGKERPLPDDEVLLMAQGKWSNKNPKYFKFSLKVKRGSNSTSQMKFREVMYAQG